jgi:hypothetical protein
MIWYPQAVNRYIVNRSIREARISILESLRRQRGAHVGFDQAIPTQLITPSLANLHHHITRFLRDPAARQSTLTLSGLRFSRQSFACFSLSWLILSKEAKVSE